MYLPAGHVKELELGHSSETDGISDNEKNVIDGHLDELALKCFGVIEPRRKSCYRSITQYHIKQDLLIIMPILATSL